VSERTTRSECVFEGRLLRVERLQVELDGGRESVREVVRHPGAAVVLGKLPDGRFVLVRQFRKPLETELLEAVAGTLHPGESPEACARREVAEETGHAAETLYDLGVIFSAPGYTDERLHVFGARLNEASDGPDPDEDEDVEVVYLAEAEVEARIADGRIGDAKTLAAWLLYRCRSPEL
jgi:ADP-ribose pyrophosphatase